MRRSAIFRRPLTRAVNDLRGAISVDADIGIDKIDELAPDGSKTEFDRHAHDQTGANPNSIMNRIPWLHEEDGTLA